MRALLLFLPFAVLIVGVWAVVFAFVVGTGRGEAAEAPGPATDDGPVPDCDCEDCQDEADFALWAEEVAADA